MQNELANGAAVVLMVVLLIDALIFFATLVAQNRTARPSALSVPYPPRPGVPMPPGADNGVGRPAGSGAFEYDLAPAATPVLPAVPQAVFPPSYNAPFEAPPALPAAETSKTGVAAGAARGIGWFGAAWSPIHPFVAGQLVVVGASLAASLPLLAPVLATVKARHGATPTAIATQLDTLQNSPGLAAGLILSVFVQNALFVGVVAYLLQSYGTTLAKIGLRRPTLRQIALGIGLGLALFAFSTGLEWVQENLLRAMSPHTLKAWEEATEKIGAEGVFLKLPNPTIRLLFALGGAVAAPIGEEVFFRGLIYNTFKARLGITPAIVLSGLCFALVHVSPLAIVPIWIMGMALAYVYERTGSLPITILMHVMNNGIAFALLARGVH